MSVIKRDWEKLQVGDVLKADSFGNRVKVKDKNTNIVTSLITTEMFFKKLHVSSSKQLEVYDDSQTQLGKITIDHDELVRELLAPENSILVFIKGFAGCGKSVFVQSLLYHILNNIDYDYSYYNYDMGADEGNDSFVKDTITDQFINRTISIIETNMGEKIFECFKKLTNYEFSNLLEGSRATYYHLSRPKTVSDNIESFVKNKHINYDIEKHELADVLHKQLEQFTLSQLLVTDYLWRLSQWIVDIDHRALYTHICYDNLDSLSPESVGELTQGLRLLRDNIDTFVDELQNYKNDFQSYNIDEFPHMTMFATFRKITAARVDLNGTEKGLDNQEYKEFIKHIDISEYYNYTDIVHARVDYFTHFLATVPYECDNLQEELNQAQQITNMEFVKKDYSSLWNNNFRVCHDIINDAIKYYPTEIQQCITIYESGNDGVQIDACYGASAIFLSLLCKLYKKAGIWGENYMDLIALERQSSKYTSLSRLILTYMLNSKNEGKISIPITDIYDKFKYIYNENDISMSISKMLTRERSQRWRRPINYSKNAIKNEKNVVGKVRNELRRYKNGKNIQKGIEIELCKSGQAFIDIITPQFEFFSSRLNEDFKPLLLITEIETLRTLINKVYEAVKNCCLNLEDFRTQYIRKYNIREQNYLSEKIHPMTKIKGRPQLYAERIIFSHIDYLNSCRLFITNILPFGSRDFIEYSTLYVDYISKYLDLYDEHIKIISAERNRVAKGLRAITNEVIESKYLSKKSISLIPVKK